MNIGLEKIEEKNRSFKAVDKEAVSRTISVPLNFSLRNDIEKGEKSNELGGVPS